MGSECRWSSVQASLCQRREVRRPVGPLLPFLRSTDLRPDRTAGLRPGLVEVLRDGLLAGLVFEWFSVTEAGLLDTSSFTAFLLSAMSELEDFRAPARPSFLRS